MKGEKKLSIFCGGKISVAPSGAKVADGSWPYFVRLTATAIQIDGGFQRLSVRKRCRAICTR